MKERVLINDNSLRVSSYLDDARETILLVNERLLPALAKIGFQPIGDESLKDCLLSGAADIRKVYFENMEKDLKGIKNPAIREEMGSQGTAAWDQFEAILAEISRDARFVTYLTMEKGKCVITAENEARLADSARIYITDPKQIEAYELHVEIVEKLNQLFNNKAPGRYRWFNLFPEDANGRIVRNENTDYSTIVGHERS